MKMIDMRFQVNELKDMIGMEFQKYRCDRFDYTNSVTQNVGIFIGDSVYRLQNVQEMVAYFGNKDDVAVMRLGKTEAENLKSAFSDTEQIETPIRQMIVGIKLINENQQLIQDKKIIYDVWLTRAVIFRFEDRELSFEKDNVPFSEEIIIRRGYDLEKNLTDENDFLDGWDNGYEPKCRREHIDIG